MTRLRRLSVPVALAAVLLTGATACGSSPSSQTPGTVAATSAAPKSHRTGPAGRVDQPAQADKAPGDLTDPCKLVTPDDLNSALHSNVTLGANTASPGAQYRGAYWIRACVRTSDASPNPAAYLTISVQAYTGSSVAAASAAAQADAQKQFKSRQLAGVELHTLSVGSFAYAAQAGGLYEVGISYGTRFATIIIGGVTAPSNYVGALTTLAQRAQKNLDDPSLY